MDDDDKRVREKMAELKRRALETGQPAFWGEPILDDEPDDADDSVTASPRQ